MDTFDGMFLSLRDPAQQLLFRLSFYEAFYGGLQVKVKEMEKSCFRAGNERCVSRHDSYLQRQAVLEREKHRATQELISNCRDWQRIPQFNEGDISQWLLAHPDCATPHLEKYLGLVQQGVQVMKEAQDELSSFLQ